MTAEYVHAKPGPEWDLGKKNGRPLALGRGSGRSREEPELGLEAA